MYVTKRSAHQQCILREIVIQVQCCFTPTRPLGLFGTGSQDGHLDFHTAPGRCETVGARQCFVGFVRVWPLAWMEGLRRFKFELISTE